jgi:hypothetical protein
MDIYKTDLNKITIDTLDNDLLNTDFNIINDNIKAIKKTLSKADIINNVQDEKLYDVEMLKKMVIKWLKLDDNVKECNKRAKEFKEEKIQIEDKILSFMNNSNTNEIQVKDGKLEKKCGQKKEPINEEYIKKCLVKSFDDVETVDKLTKMLLESREITETYKLSRKINKVKKMKV